MRQIQSRLAFQAVVGVLKIGYNSGMFYALSSLYILKKKTTILRVWEDYYLMHMSCSCQKCRKKVKRKGKAA